MKHFDAALDALESLVHRGVIVPSDDFKIEKLPDGRQQVSLSRELSPPPAAGPTDCDECAGITVWSDSNPSHTGTPIVCKSVDVTITLPLCSFSWTYHFHPNTSSDRFTVNGVEYNGCTPLFGSPLPDKDGTVLVSVSGRVLHIVVQCSCATPPVRNSSWDGYIVCNIA